MTKRHTNKQVETWRRDGGSLIQNLLSPEDVVACHKDMASFYAGRGQGKGVGQAVNLKKEGQIGIISGRQFKNFDDMPFDCSPALNLLALHPSVIALARDALGTQDVHLYQSHAWAKFTGETDYDQHFHCDYKNHTLTVPSEEEKRRTINIMIYLTDVTDSLGALHYVSKPESDSLVGIDDEMFPDEKYQHALKAFERSSAAPAGSAFAYGIDVYHRGTNLTEPNGYRYTLTASFKASGNDMIGWSAWPVTFLKRWDLIFDNATPDQLYCLGVPRPGDTFWTEKTLRQTKARWPNWDNTAYVTALR
jgi:ectoine hydroxylase-related dioxygenase (phytanoyl-CoA dioxygenase family)